MKKTIHIFTIILLVIGTFGCQGESDQISAENPSETTESAENSAENTPQTDENSEENETPKNTGNDDDNNNVESVDDTGATNEIEAKLKTALPQSNLEVKEKDDDIVIKGTVASESDMKKIEKIVSQIKTTKSVKVEAAVGSQDNY
jgi:Flp pilus assembly secretin CpaC